MLWLKLSSPFVLGLLFHAIALAGPNLSAEELSTDSPATTGPALTASSAKTTEQPANEQSLARFRGGVSSTPEGERESEPSSSNDTPKESHPIGTSPQEGEPPQQSLPDSSEPPEISPKPVMETTSKPEANAEKPPSETPRPPELSKEMAAFRDRIRRTLGRYYQQPASTNANTAEDVLLFSMAFGCEAEIRHAAGKINAVGCLCWNFPCAGYRLLRAGKEGIVPRVGYGLQSQPSQLLAVLGQTAVPITYELRVDQHRGTVADLVAYEKQTCRSGQDQSLKLVGLACYVRDDVPWKNSIGEDWSLERLLKEELDRTVGIEDVAATNRLLGLSYAVKNRGRSERPLEGQYERAVKFLDEFQSHALAIQNSDGSWHPSFFALQGTSRDSLGTLRSTGHIVHWLTYWLPDSELQTAEILRAANYLDNGLSSMASRWNVASASPREMDAVAHALGALMTFDRRVFRFHDASPQTDEASVKVAPDVDP